MLKKLIFIFLFTASILFSTTSSDWTNMDIGRGLILKQKYYRICYNTNYKIADNTIYLLTREKLTNQITDRYSHFITDVRIDEKFRAYNKDYALQGYDKGHLVNSEDMKFSTNAQKDCFLLSNIVPQNPNFNRGLWKQLENYARKKAMESGWAIIRTGTIVFDKRISFMGQTKIAIPNMMYKTIITTNERMTFVFTNKSYPKNSNITNYIKK